MRNKNIIIVILLIIIVILGSALIYFFMNNPTSDNKDNINKEATTTKNDPPKKNEPYENETTLESGFTDESEEIDLKYDQYVTANGFAGASDIVYYTRNNVLYRLILSSQETIRLAEGVEKIEEDIDNLNAYKGKDFRLIEEDSYVTYK